MAAISNNYVYLPIADAKKAVNMKVNIFAKVSEIGSPKRSRGTDYVLRLKIVDQSCPPPGLTVNFFAENMKWLPDVKAAWDIISLQCVEMKVHNGEVYCVFNKRVSSFALFCGKSTSDFDPYQKSPKYSAQDHSHNFLIELRALLPEHLTRADAGSIKRLILLKDIVSGDTFDIVCKILHFCGTSENESMVFVWDGTDCPPIEQQTNLDMELEKQSPLYLELLPLSRETLCSFPCVGTVLRLTANGQFEDIHHLRSAECWVKFCNVTCEVQSGMWKGVLSSSSKRFMLSDENIAVKHRKRIYEERCTCKLSRMPSASFPEPSHITETDHENVTYSTLMDTLTSSEAVHKCKCVVRVVASCPWRGGDLCSPHAGYRIRLTLEDPTARIHAYICEEAGVKFFGGHPTADELTQKMSRLLGMKDTESDQDNCTSRRNPPWVWFCLLSCQQGEGDPWGSRIYAVCDTRLANKEQLF